MPGAAVGRAEVGPTSPQARPDYGLPRLGSWGAGLLPNSEARHCQHLINLKGRHESGCGYPWGGLPKDMRPPQPAIHQPQRVPFPEGLLRASVPGHLTLVFLLQVLYIRKKKR